SGGSSPRSRSGCSPTWHGAKPTIGATGSYGLEPTIRGDHVTGSRRIDSPTTRRANASLTIPRARHCSNGLHGPDHVAVSRATDRTTRRGLGDIVDGLHAVRRISPPWLTVDGQRSMVGWPQDPDVGDRARDRSHSVHRISEPALPACQGGRVPRLGDRDDH